MEHEYELNEYIEKAAASKGNNSPQTPTITLNGKGVAVLASVIIVILLTILALLIANIAIFWPIRSCTCDSAPSVSNVYPSTNDGDCNCSIIYDDMQNRMTLLQNNVNELVNTSEGTAWKIDDIHSSNINNTRDINTILETTGNSTQKLMNIVNTLSDHKDASTSSNNDLKVKVDQLNSVIRDEVQTQISAILNKTTTCVANDIEQINITESILKITGESAQKLMNIVNTLSDHKDASTSSNNDLKVKVDQLNSVIRDEVQTQISAILNKTTTCVANDIEQINITESILKITGESAQKLMSIVNTLSNHRDTSTSTAGVVDEILLVVQELLVLHNDTADLPTSCQQIKAQNPNSPSGVYLTVPANGGSAIYTYCNMDTLCGSGGGWTRLAYLDMSDATQSCPSGFRLYQSGGVRACGRPVSNSGSCVSVQFSSNGISYSQVCGRVVGYQYGTPDAVQDDHGSNHNNLNGDYVDGVSITRGSPRQHVWTLMADNGHHHCPCNVNNNDSPQSFIGNHYFCEAETTSCCGFAFYTSDPLWDGKGCDSTETACCSAPGLPWFHRDYGNTTTTDYVELRVCGDEGTGNEDVPVSFYEIYVK